MKNVFLPNYFLNLCKRTNTRRVSTKNEGSRTQQYIAAVCACLTMAATGSYQAWSSPAISHLKSKNFTFSVTDEQISWIVSLYNIGDLFGGIINPLFIDRIGRRNTLFFLSLPSLIGWALIIFAQNYQYLYIARFFGGISQASAFNSLSIYLTEISEKNIRGILVNILQVSLYLAIFIFSTIGTFASYEVLNISSLALLIIFLVVCPFLPETPYFYLLKGRKNDALKCLMKLRGITSADKLQVELQNMEIVVEEDRKNSKSFAFLELFKKSYNRKGLLIVLAMRMTMMLSGIICIIAFAEEILSQNNLPIKPGIQVMIVNGVVIPASLCTSLFIDKISRRLLFAITALLSSLCLVILGLFFFLKYFLEKDTASFAWLPVVSLSFFQLFFVSGFGIIPHISVGELFPIKVKSSAVSFGRIVTSIASFLTTAAYKPLNDNFGIYTTFWIFATFSFVGAVVTYWITPNTTRMSLEEIQAMQNPKLENKLNSE